MYSNYTWLLAVVLLSDILCTPLFITNQNEKRSDNEKLNINQETVKTFIAETVH